MPTPFSRTLRALHDDAPRRGREVAILLVLLTGWLVWAVAGRVSLVAVSRRARFESRDAVRQIAVPLSGRISSVNVVLGETVRRGDVLVALDGAVPSIRRVQALENGEHLRRRIEAVSAQIAATRVLAEAQRETLALKLRRASENRIQAEHIAAIEAAKADRFARLSGDGLVPASEAIEARDRAEAGRAQVRGLVVAEEEVTKQHTETVAALQAKLRELDSVRIGLEAQLASEEAELHQADLEIERFRVRAPADGRIASSAELRPGVWVAEGTVIGSIVPPDPGEVTAWFGMRDMPGVYPGQAASIWLEAAGRGGRLRFPAVVTGVENDATGEEFRVTLRLDQIRRPSPRIGEGFPAVATIEVQRLSPLDALLRAAGMLSIGRRDP